MSTIHITIFPISHYNVCYFSTLESVTQPGFISRLVISSISLERPSLPRDSPYYSLATVRKLKVSWKLYDETFEKVFNGMNAEQRESI